MKTTNKSQGYVLLATGKRRYYEMAINAALSARWKDPGKNICLVHGQDTLPAYAADVFDDLIELPPKAGYEGCMNKMRLYDVSPYDETFYLDGDCFIVKDDMDRHWEKYGLQDFSLAGDKATDGSWYGFDIQKTCSAIGVPYLIRGNTGVFFFRKGMIAETVFDYAQQLVVSSAPILGVVHQGRKDQYSDEPFIAAAMGHSGLPSLSYTAAEGSVMITTLYARGTRADMTTSESFIKKPASGLPTDRLWALKYAHHNPTVMHFINLKPRKVFTKLSKQVRDKFGLPHYDVFN